MKKEKHLLFTGQTVRALLAGKKTQTRRLVKPQPARKQLHEWKGKVIYDGEHGVWGWKNHLWWDAMADCYGMDTVSAELLPFSPWSVGDRVWVRETWYCDHAFAETKGTAEQISEWREMMYYRADVPGGRFADADSWGEWGGGWKPSIHMPRWASRIDLEITGVRVERLNKISVADAVAEGTDGVPAYKELWEGLEGVGSWDTNPWVWVLDFRRVR